MCLVLFAVTAPDAESRRGFVLAANRDEFHDRESAVMDFRRDRPAVLAGRDERHGGTWLGVHRSGAVAFVTNVRQATETMEPRSRGELPFITLAALESAPGATPLEAVRTLAATALETRPYNLVLLGAGGAAWATNRRGGAPGFHSEAIGPGGVGRGRV